MAEVCLVAPDFIFSGKFVKIILVATFASRGSGLASVGSSFSDCSRHGLENPMHIHNYKCTCKYFATLIQLLHYDTLYNYAARSLIVDVFNVKWCRDRVEGVS